MSKQNKKGLAYADATPAQIAAAKQIIDDAAKHRYYVSRIYGMYNAVTGKNEAPQTCSSCLRARSKEIKKWYDEGQPTAKKEPKAEKVAKVAKVEDKPVQEAAAATGAKVDEPAKAAEAELDPNGLPAPAEGVVRIPMEDGTFIDFAANDGADFVDGVKGLATTTEGKKVNAGTFKTAQGDTVKVQVGGKATYVKAYDDLAS